MRKFRLCVLACGLLAASLGPSRAQEASRTAEIRERLADANRFRDHVMVVAHRGGGLAAGKTLYPENSLASVEGAIRAGAEIVELDILKSRDDQYVVFHDSYLDRTTTCRGRLAERTVAELKTCHLVVEGTGAVTRESLPTLAEMLSHTKGRILVNIDNKMDESELAGIAALARRMGMADELIVKQNLWNAGRIQAMAALEAKIGPDVMFMPIVADDAVQDAAFLEEAAQPFRAVALELIHWRRPGAAMTADGGPLFTARARAIAARRNFHFWVNTYAIVNKDGGYLAGGRGDELAVLADLPAESYGFWAERGATIIQTDEPEAAVRWLAANGWRVPYPEHALATAAVAPSN